MESSKFRDFLRNNYLYFIVIFGCLAYIISGLVEIQNTGKSVGEILASGALALFFGFFIAQLLGMQGMFKAEMNPKVIDTNKLHGETVDSVVKYINRLDNWCEAENKNVLANVRRKILSHDGLKYSDYFDDDGNAIQINFDLWSKNKAQRKRERSKMRTFYKATRVKITTITTSALTSGGEKSYDPYYLGKTKKDYEIQTSSKSLFTKVVCAILFGCYGVNMIDFNPALLIWTVLQVALFLIMGAMKYINSYFFVVDDLRKRTIRQIDILQKFKADMEANPDGFQGSKLVIENKEEKEQVNG